MLADATRVQVLWSLTHREMSVNELAEHVGKPAPSVSQHLAKLRMARLVRTRRDGTTIFYSLENDHVRQLVTDAVFNAEHAGPGVPRHHRRDAGLKAVTESVASKEFPQRKLIIMSEQHSHDAPHAHEHQHGDEAHTHAHTTHAHDHVTHEHPHPHDDGTEHTHQHVHQAGLEDAHNHSHT